MTAPAALAPTWPQLLRRRVVCVATGAAAFAALIVADPAWSGLGADATSATSTASSLTWKGVPSTSSATPTTTSALTLTWGSTLAATSQYFYIHNTGTAPLKDVTYRVANNGANVTLRACVGGLWEGATCTSGVIWTSPVYGSTTATGTILASLAVNAPLSVEITREASLIASETTIDVVLTRANVRDATVTNS